MAAKKTAKKAATKSAPVKKGKAKGPQNLLDPKSILMKAPLAPLVVAAADVSPIFTAQAPLAPIETRAEDLKELKAKDTALRAVANTLNKEGRKVLLLAEEAPNPYMYRRPTGVMELDLDIGGGFPAGGMCIVSGPDNSGKTWLLLRAMAFQQRLFGNATRLAIAITEGVFPYDQAIKAGLKIPVPDMILEQWQQWRRDRGIPLYTREDIAKFKEKVGDVYLLRGAHGEEICDAIVDLVETNSFSLIGLDSLNGLMPMANIAKEMTDNDKRAAHATMMTKFLNKYIPITTNFGGGLNKTSLVCTGQVRANQEKANAPSYMQAALKDWAPTGGWAQKHFKLIELLLWDTQVIKQGNDEKKIAVGKKINWKLEKGKAGTHDNKQGEMMFYYALGGTDMIGDLMVSGIRRGVIQQRGSQVIVVRPDTKEVLEGYTAPDGETMRRMIEADFEYELGLRREIYASVGVQCLFR